MSSRLLALLCTSLLLAGCGWHLRGLENTGGETPAEVDVEITIPALRIESESVDYRFSEAFSDYALDAGVEVSDDALDAPRFILHTSLTEQEIATLNEQGHATSFVLHYSVTYELRNAAGRILIAREKIETNRDLEFGEEDLIELLGLDDPNDPDYNENDPDNNPFNPKEDYLSQHPTLIEEESEPLLIEMEQELSDQILKKIQSALEFAETHIEQESSDEAEQPDETEQTASDETEETA